MCVFIQKIDITLIKSMLYLIKKRNFKIQSRDKLRFNGSQKHS